MATSDPHTRTELQALSVIGCGHANIIATLAPVTSADGEPVCLPMDMCAEDLMVRAHSGCKLEVINNIYL
jgi:hypothetical protein